MTGSSFPSRARSLRFVAKADSGSRPGPSSSSTAPPGPSPSSRSTGGPFRIP